MADERERLRSILDEILIKYKDNKDLKWKIQVIGERMIEGKKINFSFYEQIANLTEQVNYGCDFVNGVCKNKRDSHSKRKEMCCCKECFWSTGYLHIRSFDQYSHIETIEQEILYYAKQFERDIGFWRKDIGCVLPREKRSPTCLGHNCNYGKFTTEERLLTQILNSFKWEKQEHPIYLNLIIELLKNHFEEIKKSTPNEGL